MKHIHCIVHQIWSLLFHRSLLLWNPWIGNSWSDCSRRQFTSANQQALHSTSTLVGLTILRCPTSNCLIESTVWILVSCPATALWASLVLELWWAETEAPHHLRCCTLGIHVSDDAACNYLHIVCLNFFVYLFLCIIVCICSYVRPKRDCCTKKCQSHWHSSADRRRRPRCCLAAGEQTRIQQHMYTVCDTALSLMLLYLRGHQMHYDALERCLCRPGPFI